MAKIIYELFYPPEFVKIFISLIYLEGSITVVKIVFFSVIVSFG